MFDDGDSKLVDGASSALGTPNEEEKSRPTLLRFLRKSHLLAPDGTWYVSLHTFTWGF